MTEKDMERELRKSKNILVVLGYGVMMFAAWNLFKAILTCTLDFGVYKEMISSAITAEDLENFNMSKEAFVRVIEIFIITAVLVISLVDTLIRIRVGLSAVAEGKGKKSGKFYLAASVIIILVSLLSIYTNFTELIHPNESTEFENTIASLIFDITSLIIVLQMIYYAKRVRKLTKELSQ